MSQILAQISPSSSGNGTDLLLGAVSGYALLTILIPMMILFMTLCLIMITFSLTSISDKLQKLVNFIEEREDQELTKINNNFEEVVGSEKKTVAKNKDKSVAVASIGVLIGLSVIVVGAVSDEYSVKIGLIASGAALTIISTIIPLSQKLSRKNDPSPSSDNASEINDKQDPLTSDQ